jgi:hypothetical protein
MVLIAAMAEVQGDGKARLFEHDCVVVMVWR